jgi:HlyD family secretion protein
MKRLRRWIVIILVIAIVGGGGFAFFRVQGAAAQAKVAATQAATLARVERGSITETVSGTGSVYARQTVTLSWQTGGTVASVPVKVGQQVKAGDVLASLAPSSYGQDVISAQNDLVSAKQALQDLYDSAATNLASSQAAQATAQIALDQAQTTWDAMNSPRPSQAVINQTLADYNAAQRQVGSLLDDYHRANRLYDPTDPHVASVTKDLTDAQLKAQQLLADYNWMTRNYTPEDLFKAQTALATAKAQMADAQRNIAKWQNGPSAADVQVAQSRIDKDQAAINNTSLTAPFSGTVTSLTIMPGDVVTAGTTAMRIDDMTHRSIDVRVSEVDINRVKLGQTANVNLDAVSGKTYTGKVTEIGQVGTASGGVVYFTVTLELTDANAAVKPGMTATVDVVISQANDVLLVPAKAIRRFGNRAVVLVPNGKGRTQPVQVTVGATNATQAEIQSDTLKEGDIVEANPANTGFFGGGFGGPPAGGFGEPGRFGGGG